MACFLMKTILLIQPNYELMLEWIFLLCQHLHINWDAKNERRIKEDRSK